MFRFIFNLAVHVTIINGQILSNTAAGIARMGITWLEKDAADDDEDDAGGTKLQSKGKTTVFKA